MDTLGDGARRGNQEKNFRYSLGKEARGIVAIESYARGREMETAGENKREFDRLMRKMEEK